MVRERGLNFVITSSAMIMSHAVLCNFDEIKSESFEPKISWTHRLFPFVAVKDSDAVTVGTVSLIGLRKAGRIEIRPRRLKWQSDKNFSLLV